MMGVPAGGAFISPFDSHGRRFAGS
jgi:hypothetical protein